MSEKSPEQAAHEHAEFVGLRLMRDKDGLKLQKLQLVSSPQAVLQQWSWLDVPIVNEEETLIGWAFSQEMLQRFS